MPESLNKKEQPQSEEMPEKLPSSDSEVDREPTEEMLEPFRDMTKEEWETKRQEWKQEIAAWRTDEERKKEERREKWERRTKALESIQPTGDIVEDAEAFFEAAEITDLGEFDSNYGGAFTNKDRKGMLQCFKDYERNPRADFLPPAAEEMIVRYFRTFDQVVKKIISAAELVEEKQKSERLKE